MAYQVFRTVVDKATLRSHVVQAIGSPFPTRQMAENKIIELHKMSNFPYEVCIVPETTAMRDSWIRKGFLPPEQPAKQRSLIERLGPNGNKFLPVKIDAEGTTGTAPSAQESILPPDTFRYTRNEQTESMILQALKRFGRMIKRGKG
jgi:hypothetical protein